MRVEISENLDFALHVDLFNARSDKTDDDSEPEAGLNPLVRHGEPSGRLGEVAARELVGRRRRERRMEGEPQSNGRDG